MEQQHIDRRGWMAVAGATVVLAAAAHSADAPKEQVLIGVNTSPRKGKTTAAALALCLQAAHEARPELKTELIELGDLSIPAQVAAGVPLKPGEVDDFPALAAKLGAPEVCGVIVGSPVYFGNMSALCKAFIDRCYILRQDGYRWSGKPAGVVAVGSTRNGGQEMVIRSIHTGLMGQDMVLVGTGRPSVRIGATLWNQDDSIEKDTFGIGTAKDLGKHMAAMCARLAE